MPHFYRLFLQLRQPPATPDGAVLVFELSQCEKSLATASVITKPTTAERNTTLPFTLRTPVQHISQWIGLVFEKDSRLKFLSPLVLVLHLLVYG